MALAGLVLQPRFRLMVPEPVLIRTASGTDLMPAALTSSKRTRDGIGGQLTFPEVIMSRPESEDSQLSRWE
jgi:hypothetical protein